MDNDNRVVNLAALRFTLDFAKEDKLIFALPQFRRYVLRKYNVNVPFEDKVPTRLLAPHATDKLTSLLLEFGFIELTPSERFADMLALSWDPFRARLFATPQLADAPPAEVCQGVAYIEEHIERAAL
ncbi:MAG: hypothetical protein HC927_00215 [Deltaproteobacteria bacterium]|nr:hypothetical protein [Deltaproteobacteria bacterium]